MSAIDSLLATLRLVLLLAGLVLPGTALLRAGRVPWSLGASHLASCALLYLVVLGFTLLHVPVGLGSLVAALAGLTAAGFWFARRGDPPGEPAEARPWAFLTGLGRWTPLVAVFWIVVVFRLATDPLSGPDVHFRWSHLAEELLRRGSLDFYPPRSGDDFVRYFWPESIPPGVASVYAWAYACAGSIAPLWAAQVTLLQLLSLHDLAGRFAGRLGGIRAARGAIVLLTSCPLLTWSFLIGQETGLLALAAVGLAWSLDAAARPASGSGWTIVAAASAIVASSSREYGLVFALVAVIAAVALRLGRSRVLVLAGVAWPVAALWPLRTWWLTGNPFYSLNVGGIFPVNPVFSTWNDAFRAAQQSTLSTFAGWRELTRYLVLWALPAVLGLAALVALLRRRAGGAALIAALVALVSALWFTSVAYTAGGLFYSLRVLAPAFALLVVAAAVAGSAANAAPGRERWLGICLAVVALEALPKTLVLPDNPYRVPVREWLGAGRAVTESFHASDQELLAKMAVIPGRKRVVSDGFDLPALAAPVGVEVAPLWSPDYRWLFDRNLDPAEAARQWKDSGLRFLVIGRTGPMKDFVQNHAILRTPHYSLELSEVTQSHVFMEFRPTGSTPP